MKKILMSIMIVLGLGCGSVFAHDPYTKVDRRMQYHVMHPGTAPRTFNQMTPAGRSRMYRAPNHAPAPAPIHRGQIPHFHKPIAVPMPVPCPPPPAPHPSLFNIIIRLF